MICLYADGQGAEERQQELQKLRATLGEGTGELADTGPEGVSAQRAVLDLLVTGEMESVCYRDTAGLVRTADDLADLEEVLENSNIRLVVTEDEAAME